MEPKDKKNSGFTKESKRDDGKTDIYFRRDNRDDDKHGHVVQSDTDDGQTKYHYVRDEDGDVYIDDSKDD